MAPDSSNRTVSRFPPPPARQKRSRLALIRVALLLSVLLFGAVTWYARRDGTMPPPDRRTYEAVRTVAMILWAVSITGIIGLRLWTTRARRDDDARIAVVAWALGEAPALVGGVFWFVTGQRWLWASGVVVLLTSFILFPVRTVR